MVGFFFFNDTATTEIYTLSLHDALPISNGRNRKRGTEFIIGRECRWALSSTSMEPIQRIHELRKLLDQANFDYYIEAEPTMGDSEYDRLIVELVSLEAAHPKQFDAASPTQRVGGQPSDGFKTVQHSVPMQSIDNTYTIDDLRL